MWKNRKGKKVILAGLFILISSISHLLGFSPIYQDIILILSTLIAGFSIFKQAIVSLKYRILGIDALVTIAVIGALFIGEYFESAAVTFLFIFGSYLEAKTLEKTRQALKSLMDMAPQSAIVLRNHKQIEISAQDVTIHDTIIVKPGGKVAVDGVILKGQASINQSLITGESLPVHKKEGEAVFSGTIVETGYLEVKAEKVGDDTSFAKIIEIVEEAQDKKAPTQKFIERFAKYYTPFIILLAIIIYLLTYNLQLTLTLLVIACPGALVISTPVSIVSGIGNGAKKGILIKGGEYLEKANKVNLIAFDKTGTLTIGCPKVIHVYPYDVEKDDLLNIAASIEIHSEHHIAKAITEEVTGNLQKVEEFTAFQGKGVLGKINGVTYYIGNEKLISDYHIRLNSQVKKQLTEVKRLGQTAVLISKEEKIIGIITIADKIREEAQQMIKDLKLSGIKKVIMLTGDNDGIAKAVGEKVEIDEVYANLLPEEKLNLITQLKQKYTVAMVGDGVNDAPSLVTADVGISMGDVGTDVAVEAADVVLLSNNLNRIPELFSLSHATNRNLKQNLSFALLVVFVLLIGVILGKVFMALGMLVHEMSVFIVILNAIRLNYYRTKKGQ